jgi:opacity protein-like surface antigen
MRRAAVALAVAGVAAAGLAGFAGPAAAEGYFSLYGGGAFISKAKLDNRGGDDLGRFDLDLDQAGLFGGKVGYWLDRFPHVGFELDISHASPDIGTQTRSVAGVAVPISGSLRMTSLGLHALLRYPLGISKAYPSGQFQPYLGAGVGLLFGKLSLSGSGRGIPDRGPGAGVSGTITFSGTDSSDETPVPRVVAGLKMFFLENLSGFLEYQFAHADLTFGSPRGSLNTKFSSHSIAAGLSYHFDLFK